jgi:hypothetical protein
MLGFECPSLLETIRTGILWFSIREAAVFSNRESGFLKGILSVF